MNRIFQGDFASSIHISFSLKGAVDVSGMMIRVEEGKSGVKEMSWKREAIFRLEMFSQEGGGAVSCSPGGLG